MVTLVNGASILPRGNINYTSLRVLKDAIVSMSNFSWILADNIENDLRSLVVTRSLFL